MNNFSLMPTPARSRLCFGVCCFLVFASACGAIAQTAATPGASQADPVAAMIQAMINRHEIPGAIVLIANKDKVFDTVILGDADLKTHKPLKRNDEFWIASMTKPMTAVALMMLVDEGKVNVDDPVEKYLPEFKGQKVRAVRRDPANKSETGFGALVPATHPITIREIMCHIAGLPFQSKKEHDPLDSRPLKDAVKTYAEEPLLYQPGTDYTYSNEDLNTTGRIVEVVSGMPYEQFLQQRIFDPLGMKDTTFWPNQEQIARLAKSYKPDGGLLTEVPLTQVGSPLDDRKHRFPIPAGGLFSTADDCLGFMQMMVNHGVYHGKRLVSEASVHEMTILQNKGLGKTQGGLGWRVRNGDFDHSGHHKTFMGEHTKTGTILVFMTQIDGKIPDFDKDMGDLETAGDKLIAASTAH